ncbi:MAG: restriction endonuclease subunit S [Bacteroidaceae bacterium]|nr:restriction endonuclease subunit S [Bacteroidaceae bacterium]
MSEWKCYKLNEISSLSNGINFDKSAYTSGVKLIGVSDFKNRIHPDYDSLQEVDSKVVKSGDYLEKGDIVFVRSNGNKELVGRCMMIDRDIPVTYSGFCIKLRLKDKKLFDPVFFNYLFRTRQFKKSMTGTAVGANIQNLSQSRLGSCEVNVPDIEKQKEIATILSRYDSLIENYQKQIKLLEEAAQRLYKEWFVDLHFPGHENTKIVDGVPEGWEKKRVGDMLISHMNGGWGKDSSTGSNVIQASVIRGTDIDKIKGGVFDDLPIRFHTEKEILNKHLEVNDIILELSNGNINNVGRTLRIDDNLIKQYGKRVICASFCKFLRPIDYRISIILFSEFQDMHNGSRMQKFKKNGANGINNFDFQEFLKHEVLVPPVSFTIKELEIIQKSISDYRVQIRLLSEARDRLLPKLMSRELQIKNK